MNNFRKLFITTRIQKAVSMDLLTAKKQNTKQDKMDIILPASILESTSTLITGKPNFHFIRIVYTCSGMITLGIGLSMLAVPFFPSNNNSATASSLAFLLALLLIGFAIAIFRQTRKLPHHEMWLDDLHFGISTPCSFILTPPCNEREIPWENITKSPKGLYDIDLEFSTRKSITYDLVFWHKKSDDSPEEIRVPLRRFSAKTFTNGYELKRCLLLKLATLSSDFRFNPDVFVEAGIDPESWVEMRKPLLIKRSMLFPSIFIFMIYIFKFDFNYSFWQHVLFFISTTAIYATVFSLAWIKIFPRFKNTIHFYTKTSP